MPYRVLSNTGDVFFPEEGVAVHHEEPTLVDELTPSMEYQRKNLRITEVDEEGNELPAPAPPDPLAPEATEAQARAFAETNGLLLVEKVDHDAASGERDRLAKEADALNVDAAKSAEKHEAELKALRDQAEADAARHKEAVDGLSTAAASAKADHAAEVAALKEAHKAELQSLADKAKADGEKLVADHKAEVEGLKGQLAEAKKGK